MGLSEIKKKKSWKHWWVEVKNLKAIEHLTTFQLHKSLLIISLAHRNPKSQLKKKKKGSKELNMQLLAHLFMFKNYSSLGASLVVQW